MKGRIKAVVLGLVLALAVLVAVPSYAQTVALSAAFTFNSSSQIVSWNGSDPSNPPFPYEMGAISLNSSFGGGYGSGLDVPFQLGFLNNGFLSPCNPIAFGAKVWTNGTGTRTGDTFTVSGSTTCPYFTGEWGTYENSNNRLDGFSVTASYVRTSHTACRYGRCTTYYTDTLQGGSGVVTDSTIN
jgi:hypothetical protein